MMSSEGDLVVYSTPAEPEKVSTVMGLRHIKPGLTAAQKAGTGIFHPILRHPLTGEPLEAVGVVDGMILWPIIGGGEDDDDESDEDGGDDKEDDDNSDASDDTDDSGDDKKDPKARIKALEEEKDRHYRRRKKAEKERDELRAENERLKAEIAKAGKKPAKKGKAEDTDDDDDDISSELELERAARRADLEKAAAELRAAKIENAFLATQATLKIEWVNPNHVMTLLLADDDYEVEFDDHGNVNRKSLVAELKRFAKANPHLVKPKPAKQGDADGDTGTGDNSGGSASSMNGQRKGKGKIAQPTREQLAKRFPALGGR
jgi:hypothetical protein